MVSGVVLLVFGEAFMLRSESHAVWAMLFLTFNLIFMPLVEEPQLEARFGEPYRRYMKHARRFLPRLTPWRPQ